MKTVAYGVLLSKQWKYETLYVSAHLVRRDEGHDHPLNVSNFRWEMPKSHHKFELPDLCLQGFVSDICAPGERPSFTCFHPAYRDVHDVDTHRAKRMYYTLRKINEAALKDDAREPGDILMSMMRALKLDFAVKMIGALKGSSYADNEWLWTNGHGTARNAFRDMIDQAVTEVTEKKRSAA
jgi:hypothetical protein